MTTPTLSSGIVIVRYFSATPRYLLLRAYQYWDFPKGLLESGESPLDAAVREVAEETTLTDLIFRWGYAYRETPPYGRGKVARYYLAESRSGDVDLPVTEELGHPEHDEYRWLPYDQGRVLLGERLCEILHWAHGVVLAGRSDEAGHERS